jgi:hypothetical protein
MKEFKGTKGKWNIFDFKGKGSCIDIALDDKSGAIAQVYSPTEVGFNEEQTTEHKANAQLIAAAPEMLETLVAVRTQMLKTGVNYDTAILYTKINNTIKQALGKE